MASAQMTRRTVLSNSSNALAGMTAATLLKAPSAVAGGFDPMLDLVNRYNAEHGRLEGLHCSDREFDAQSALLLDKLESELENDTPAVTTMAGAIAALKLGRDYARECSGGMGPALISAAIDFLQMQA